MSRTRRRKLECLLLLFSAFLISLSVVGVRPAAATCADVTYIISTPMQMYATAIIEIKFAFTRSADGKAIPSGFSKLPAILSGTTSLRFATSENDTWRVYFQLHYDVPIQQNITLTIESGSNQPVAQQLCMNGQNAYFYWPAIQVSIEPHIPTAAELWNYGQSTLTNMVTALQNGQSAMSGTLFWIIVLVIVGDILVVVAVALIVVRAIGKWRRGTV